MGKTTTRGDRVAWVHLSDWHQHGDSFDRQVVRDALMRDLRGRAAISPALAQVDFVAFSGDIAFSGQAEEYATAARRFFGPLFTALGLGKEGWKRLFVVAGNHDLARDVLDRVGPGLLEQVADREGAEEALGRPEKRRELLAPFAGFTEFVRGRVPAVGASPYAYRRRIRVGRGRSVALVGLNSSWLSARHADGAGVVDDYGHLAVGERQVYEALERAGEADLRIAMMHHPLSWLRESDRCRVQERLFRGCDIILHGHEHMPGVNVLQYERGDVVIIPAGACYDRRVAQDPRYTNSYNLVTVDFETGEGTVYLRRWNDVGASWQADRDASPSGEVRFTLPSHKPRSPDQVAAVRTLLARDRAALGKRVFEEVDVEIRQRLVTSRGVSLVRHDIRQRVRVASGPEEEFRYVATPNPRAAEAIRHGRLSLEPQTVRLKLDGRLVEPTEISSERVAYRLALGADSAQVEYRRTLYAMPDDLWRFALRRFARRLRLRLQREQQLEYEFQPLGGLPAPRLRRRGPTDIEETESDGRLLCPRQGYLIRWWRRG
jgi:predicted phosphodiesterase